MNINREFRAGVVEARKQAQLWRALCEWIHASGGFVVSPPSINPLRFKVSAGSSLGCVLASVGHKVHGPIAQGKRWMNVPSEQLKNARGDTYMTITRTGQVDTDVFEIFYGGFASARTNQREKGWRSTTASS